MMVMTSSWQGLRYITSMQVRSTRGKNVGKKITGIQVSADGDNVR